MSEYRIRATGAVVTDSEFRNLHPNMALPEVLTVAMLNGLGADPVLPSPPPSVTSFQSVIRNGVIKDSAGNWIYAWKVINWTPEQIADYIRQGRIAIWQAIKTEANRRAVEDGFHLGGNWFPSDQLSRIRYLELENLYEGIPPGAKLRTLADTLISITPTLVQQLAVAAALQDIILFAVADMHKAKLDVAPDPYKYDYSTGWPPAYKPA